MTNLTGLELNLYERAGYVVRRGAFDAAASGDGTPDEVMAMCTDILGMEVDEIPFETRSPSGWIRASGTAIEARDTELAPLQDAVWAVSAIYDGASLCVLPGSHLQPLELPALERLRQNPADEIPGQLCLRLDKGDALLLIPTLMHMRLHSLDEGGIRGWMVRKRRRLVAGGGELCV